MMTAETSLLKTKQEDIKSEDTLQTGYIISNVQWRI